MAYHHITRIPVHRNTKEEKKFSKLARSIPSLDHPNFAKSMRELEKLVSEWSADIQKIERNKLHRALLAGRDPIGFGEVAPLTVDTGLEDATEYFRRAQDECQLIQSKLVDLHAREYQAFLKKHPSLQFKEGDRVWV